MPPTAPTVPVLLTQWSHPWANTGTQPLVTSACTRTNVEKAKGTSATGKCVSTTVAVGNVSSDHVHACETKDASVTFSCGILSGRCSTSIALLFSPSVSLESPCAGLLAFTLA